MTAYLARDDLEQRSTLYRERPSKAAIRVRLCAYLVVLDVAAVALGFTLAGEVRFGAHWMANGFSLIGALLPLYLLCATLLRAHSGDVLLARRVSMTRALAALLGASSLLSVVLVFLQAGDAISRVQMGLGIVVSAIILAGVRSIFSVSARSALGGSLYSSVELVDGLSPGSERNATSIETSRFFDPENPDPASLDRLARTVGKTDRVVVRCRGERRAAWAHVLQGLNVHAEVLVDEMLDVRPIGVGSYYGDATLVVARGPLGLRDRLYKRGFDIAFAASALLFLAPLLLVVAVLIKLESPGPALFRQPRIGRQNRLFNVYKFRSMRNDLSDVLGARSTERDDPRITRVGRFIRRTSIDELPQFLNVLLGEMSVVGPRPHAVNSTAETELFWDIDQRYWHRHACKPGITGLAQVRGFRGATNFKSDLTDRVTSDLQYLQNWSMWRDMQIIVDTVRGLSHENAY